MQKAMYVNTKPWRDEALDEELIDMLIAISVYPSGLQRSSEK